MVRRVLALALMVATLASIRLAVPAVAVPLAQSTSCDANLVVLFRPGLTLSEQSQQIKITGSLSNCVGGGVVSANGTGIGSGSLSCTSGTATANIKIRWNTGEISKVQISVDVGNGTVTGTVVSGKFAGEPATGDSR
jgi:hypothetical protein